VTVPVPPEVFSWSVKALPVVVLPEVGVSWLIAVARTVTE
jgi:hypothetical protein